MDGTARPDEPQTAEKQQILEAEMNQREALQRLQVMSINICPAVCNLKIGVLTKYCAILQNANIPEEVRIGPIFHQSCHERCEVK